LSHFINLTIAENQLAQYMDFDDDDELERHNDEVCQSLQADVEEPLIKARKIGIKWITKLKLWKHSSEPPRRTWEDKGK
jgi:hypothetical protein